jgi:quinol monooxygenase YgiN
VLIITITIIASVQVKEGKMEEAKEVLKELVPKIKQSEQGTLEYIPHTVKGRKEKNTIVFYEKYKDSEALRVHSGNLAKSLAPLMPLLEPGMDMKTCFEIV